MAKLTNAAWKSWRRKTSKDSPNAISSPASESGAMPCALPDGPMTDLFGQAVVLAPVSARQAKAEGLQMLVTSGLIGSDSSASGALQTSLENRLMTRLDSAGSTLFKLTWRRRITPLGRRYLERAASARRTSGSDCTSVPTPKVATGDYQTDRTGAHCLNLSGAAKLSAVPTPNTPTGDRSTSTDKMDATGRTLDGKKHTASLEHAVKFVSVRTPTAWSENSCRGGGQDPEKRKAGGHTVNLQDEVMLFRSVPTPSANEYEHADIEKLNARRERCKASHKNGNGFGMTLGNTARLTASGPMPSGSPVPTASTGQLNPAYSRWLMGPPARVGRLRGYGDAIVAQQAQAFIEAWLEIA